MLHGKVALVTGSSRGIGRAIAERLGKDAASVVVNYTKSADKAQKVVAAVESAGGQVLAAKANVGKIADIERLFAQTIEHFGRLDILVNNAGILSTKPIAEILEEDFDNLFAINVKGIFLPASKQHCTCEKGDESSICSPQSPT